jgi:hypothetical protein
MSVRDRLARLDADNLIQLDDGRVEVAYPASPRAAGLSFGCPAAMMPGAAATVCEGFEAGEANRQRPAPGWGKSSESFPNLRIFLPLPP